MTAEANLKTDDEHACSFEFTSKNALASIASRPPWSKNMIASTAAAIRSHGDTIGFNIYFGTMAMIEVSPMNDWA